MEAERMIDYDEQSRLFDALGKKLKRKIEVYLIGGSAMLYYKTKKATKDIDIVAASNNDFDDVKKALEEMGFYKKEPFLNIKYQTVDVRKPVFLVFGDRKIDLFINEIICFKLTETMKSRITQAHEYGNLIAKIISPEDIILLKCATERAGDRQDAKELIENYNIKWDVIVKEAEHQSELGRDLFVVYLFDFFEELAEDLKAEIPKEVIVKIRKIAEKAMIKKMKKNKK